VLSVHSVCVAACTLGTSGALQEATAIQEEENAEHIASSTDLSESVDAMGRAIDTQKKLSELGSVPEAMLQIQENAVASEGMRPVLAALLEETDKSPADGAPDVADPGSVPQAMLQIQENAVASEGLHPVRAPLLEETGKSHAAALIGGGPCFEDQPQAKATGSSAEELGFEAQLQPQAAGSSAAEPGVEAQLQPQTAAAGSSAAEPGLEAQLQPQAAAAGSSAAEPGLEAQP
jgi:hypothetical protein